MLYVIFHEGCPWDLITVKRTWSKAIANMMRSAWLSILISHADMHSCKSLPPAEELEVDVALKIFLSFGLGHFRQIDFGLKMKKVVQNYYLGFYTIVMIET